jgi:endoglucanase
MRFAMPPRTNGTIGAMVTRSIPFAALIVSFSTVQTLAEQLVRNGRFEVDQAGWWATANLQIAPDRGKLCTTVPAGTVNPWDAMIGTNELPLSKDAPYTFGFGYQGDPGGPVRALVQMQSEPFTSYSELTQPASKGQKIAVVTFVAPVDQPSAQIVFQLGGSSTAWRFCVDNVSLLGPRTKEVAAYIPETGSRIRVNQLGYLPDGPKRSTLVTEVTKPLEFTLVDGSGKTVLSGKSLPRGVDPSAGLSVHVIDFSDFEGSGKDFRIRAEGDTSLPFVIADGPYGSLRHDALSFFYPMRSGIAIEEAVAGAGYGRPAGHISRADGPDKNQGDRDVPCQPAETSLAIYGEAWTCVYTLDVTGGWYDAGDHGKYVVNGGIAVAQIMAAFERQVMLEKDGLGDGSLSIPEVGNNVPDALDEARWELEWMLKMVVPAGDPFAGMVHHKVHDNTWTGLPLLPHEDGKIRELHRPSTAATLNLAAAAALGARLFQPYDPVFADKLRVTAQKTYLAAKANPAVYAPASDGNSGGGAYDDNDVSDEFFWAVAELFITTLDPVYLADLKATRDWSATAFESGGFNWRDVSGFAWLELAAHAEKLPQPDAEHVLGVIRAGADMLLALQSAEPFGQTYSPANGRYEWGSNSSVLNNALVLAAAFDLFGVPKYRSGALEAMDYILGRNALNQSYVTGYGTRFSHRQHSRWFANASDPAYPPPPNGALAGGSNSSIQDPVAQRLFGASGCAAQLCYVDDIGAWSLNEIAINWNAALGQMAVWLADQ